MAVAAASALAGMNNPVVGGKEMYPTRNIIENAVNSADHTTLVAAVKAAGLVDTLEGAGPSPSSRPPTKRSPSFPPAPLTRCSSPRTRRLSLKSSPITWVAGRISARDLMKMIKEGNGKAELTTVEGGKLWAMQNGKTIVLKDEKENARDCDHRQRIQSDGGRPRHQLRSHAKLIREEAQSTFAEKPRESRKEKETG